MCYYPEHWSRERWEMDVREMVDDIDLIGDLSIRE